MESITACALSAFEGENAEVPGDSSADVTPQDAASLWLGGGAALWDRAAS